MQKTSKKFMKSASHDMSMAPPPTAPSCEDQKKKVASRCGTSSVTLPCDWEANAKVWLLVQSLWLDNSLVFVLLGMGIALRFRQIRSLRLPTLPYARKESGDDARRSKPESPGDSCTARLGPAESFSRTAAMRTFSSRGYSGSARRGAAGELSRSTSCSRTPRS